MKRNYDSIAWFYDRLSRLVYGRALVRVQQYLVNAIPANARVLIIGGGTGWVLEEITKIHPAGLSITYIDASAKMIALAQKRDAGGNKVTFIAAPIETVSIDTVYDVVLTPFLFDNFTDSSLAKIFAAIDKHLCNGGLWLYCDFRDTDVFWQKTVLKIMYIFFRVSCGIEATQLPDAEACFARHHYMATAQTVFLKGFVVSKIYEKVKTAEEGYISG